MKTNLSSKILRFSTPALLGIAIISTLLVQPAFGNVIVNNLVIHEFSPTRLTVSSDGSTAGIAVKFLAPDSWFVTFFNNNVDGSSGLRQWAEPEDPRLVNELGFLGDQMLIGSDVTPLPFHKIIPDGGTVKNVGIDTVNGGNINLTFFDRAANAEGFPNFPDTGSTLSLLFVTLIGLLAARRFRLA